MLQTLSVRFEGYTATHRVQVEGKILKLNGNETETDIIFNVSGVVRKAKLKLQSDDKHRSGSEDYCDGCSRRS